MIPVLDISSAFSLCIACVMLKNNLVLKLMIDVCVIARVGQHLEALSSNVLLSLKQK